MRVDDYLQLAEYLLWDDYILRTFKASDEGNNQALLFLDFSLVFIVKFN